MAQQGRAKLLKGFSVSGRLPGQTQGGQGVIVVEVGRAKDDPARPLPHTIQLLFECG